MSGWQCSVRPHCTVVLTPVCRTQARPPSQLGEEEDGEGAEHPLAALVRDELVERAKLEEGGEEDPEPNRYW